MFGRVTSSVNGVARVLCAAAVLALLFAPRAGAQMVQTYNFGAGDPLNQDWTPFGNPTLTNVVPPTPPGDPDPAPGALLTTNRTATYMGPSIDLVTAPSLQGKLLAGATYQVSANVLLLQGTTDNPTVTITTQLISCATSGTYTNVATSGALSTSQWTQVQGTFKFSDEPGPPTHLKLYIQSSSATDSYYIDNVVITEVAPPPNPADQDNTGITTTFEDGGLDGWSGRAGSTVTNSTAAAAGDPDGGTHSLLVTGRTHNYDGPQISVDNKMYNGSQYNLSAWVQLTPADGTNHVINMSLQATLNGNTSFPSITSYPGITVPADGQWHHISVNGFNMANAYDPGKAFVYFQTVPPNSGTDLTSFYIDDFQVTYVPPAVIQTNIPSIFQTLSQYFPIGAAVDPIDLTGPHAQLLTTHFNGITSGNDMKWSSVENVQGTFTFTNADNQVGLAVCHDMKVRGHNLVWASGSQTPLWVFGDGSNSAANQATVTTNIIEHIKNEVQHFGTRTLSDGKTKVLTVYAWDVVNEPLDPNQPDCLQHGRFYNVLGKSYIDLALQTAAQYAPVASDGTKTKLFINDYSTADLPRLNCLVQVVNDLKSRGIPIDGVGHEMHNAINYPSTAAMVNAINTVAENFPGLDQQVTELDMSVYNAGDTKTNYANNVPPVVLAEQGWLYKQYFDAFRNLTGKLSEVTFWGMADDDTWLDSFPVARKDRPLPFDTGLQAKWAYWGVVDPSHLPGYGMTFAATVTAGKADTRTITITATNGNVGPAYTTQLTGFTLTQVSGPPCTPTTTAPTFPISLADNNDSFGTPNISTSGAASTSFTFSIVGCNPNSQFTVSVPWTSATYDTGTFTTTIDFNRGNGSQGN